MNKRIAMRLIRDIQELKEKGCSKNKISQTLKIDRGTVIRYWDLKAPDPDVPSWANDIDWAYIKKELRQKKATRKVLYEEQKELTDLPSYQAFCKYLTKHVEIKHSEIVIPQERVPGRTVEIDYSGDSKNILSLITGKFHGTALFLSALGYSGHIYGEFTHTQQMEDFIMAQTRMFQWYGGVPLCIVPDNCKTAVTKTDKYDPLLNPTFLDMCKHYNITVDPADSASPRQKSNVENAVKYVQTDFLMRIRNKTYTSLMEINRDLKIWLKEINNKPIQGRGKSRNYFLEKERPLLRPLPEVPYEIYYFKKAKVHPDCHFQLNKNYYSVPYKFVGKEIDLKFNSRMVHAWYNCDKLASHSTAKGTYHYSTNTNHFPEWKYVETNYHLGKAREKAKSIGENTSILIEKLIKTAKHPLKILRKVQGITRLKNKYPKEALDYACEQALYFDRMNYDNIKRFADNFKKDKFQVPKDTPKRDEQYSFLQGEKNDTKE